MEKTYLIMKRSGIVNIIIGVETVLAGMALIAFGTTLYKERSNLLF